MTLVGLECSLPTESNYFLLLNLRLTKKDIYKETLDIIACVFRIYRMETLLEDYDLMTYFVVVLQKGLVTLFICIKSLSLLIIPYRVDIHL